MHNLGLWYYCANDVLYETGDLHACCIIFNSSLRVQGPLFFSTEMSQLQIKVEHAESKLNVITDKTW